MSRRLTALLLFFGGCFSVASHVLKTPLGPGFEVLAIARTLVATGVFANPFATGPTGPTALCPPLYPAFLALLMWAIGNSIVSALAMCVCSMAMHGLHSALLPSMSGLLLGDRRPGLWAAGISIVLPVFYFFPQFEIMYAATGLMLFCLASARLVRGGGVGHALATGGLAGLMMLLNPATVCVMAPWLLYCLWRTPAVRGLRFAGYVMMAGLLTVAPWIWRNYRQFHMFVPVRDNLGLELYVANNDLAQPSFLQNEASHLQKHPGGSEAEAQAVRSMGEAQYSRSRSAMATEWIRSHPARFLNLTLTRIRMFWFSEKLDQPLHLWTIAATTAISFLGLLLLALRRHPAGLFIAAVWLIYPSLYYFVQADVRYRVPVLWLTLLATGYLLHALWEAAAGRVKEGVAVSGRESTAAVSGR